MTIPEIAVFLIAAVTGWITLRRFLGQPDGPSDRTPETMIGRLPDGPLQPLEPGDVVNHSTRRFDHWFERSTRMIGVFPHPALAALLIAGLASVLAIAAFGADRQPGGVAIQRLQCAGSLPGRNPPRGLAGNPAI